MWDAAGLPGRFLICEDGPHHDWGHTPRNRFMSLVRTSHMMHMDDDDSYMPGAIAAAREAIAKHPDRVILFRMKSYNGHSSWENDYHVCYLAMRPRDAEGKPIVPPRLRWGNVSTQLIVHPANGRYGTWVPRYGGDFDFIKETITLSGFDPVWDNRLIVRKDH
jgi:hypothetical protein